MQIIDLYLIFRFLKERCHGNQLILGKCHECQLILLAFFALSLENYLQYHCLYVGINSRDDVSTSCKNLVNFCRVTPEIMVLICVPEYLYLWRKSTYTSIFVMPHSETPWSIGTWMGALTAAVIRLHPVSIWWVSDQYIQSSRELTLYNRSQSALGLVYLRSLGGSTVMFTTTC